MGMQNKEKLTVIHNGINSDKHYDFELLADYADGILNAQVTDEIRNHLRKCDACRSTVQGIQYYYESTKQDREAMDEYLAGFRADLEPVIQNTKQQPSINKQKSGRNPYFYIVRVAAIFLIALLPLASYLYMPTTSNSLDGYLQTPYRSDIQLRGTETVEETQITWKQAIKEYGEQNYAAAIPLIQKSIAEGNVNGEQHFYLGLSHLYQENADYAKATEHLQEVFNTKNRYQQQAKWFLCLAYLKQNDTANAKQYLSGIATQNGHYKQAEAKELLDNL